MTDLPVAGFFANASRTNAEAKQGQDDMLAVIRQMLGGNAESTLTLAADAATPSRGTHSIDTEGAAASDNLANLVTTNLPDGSFLLIRAASAARVVTVKHNAGGTGQIALFGAADAVLDATSKWLLLKRTGANWEEVGRFPAMAAVGTITLGRGMSANANGTQGGSLTGNVTLRNMTAQYENVAASGTINLANISNGTSALNITGNNVTINGFSGLAGLPDIPFKIGNGTLTLQTGGNLTISAGNVTLDAGSVGVIRPLTNTTAEIIAPFRANGTPVAAGSSGGMTLISTANASDVANVSFSVNLSSWRALKIIGTNIRPHSDNQNLTLDLLIANGSRISTQASSAQSMRMGFPDFNTSGVIDFQIGQFGWSNNSVNISNSIEATIFTPENGSNRLNGCATCVIDESGNGRGWRALTITGWQSANSTNVPNITTARLAFGSGNISGNISIYGVSK